jgi:hypothetical protein
MTESIEKLPFTRRTRSCMPRSPSRPWRLPPSCPSTSKAQPLSPISMFRESSVAVNSILAEAARECLKTLLSASCATRKRTSARLSSRRARSGWEISSVLIPVCLVKARINGREGRIEVRGGQASPDGARARRSCHGLHCMFQEALRVGNVPLECRIGHGLLLQHRDRDVDRRECLADLVMELATDALALILLGRRAPGRIAHAGPTPSPGLSGRAPDSGPCSPASPPR